MTSNKMEKGIQKSMLDDLLSDSDKPKPPPAPTPRYSGGRYGSDGYYDDEYDWRNGDPLPASMSDSDDDDYQKDIPAFLRKPATTHRQRTSIFKQSERMQAPLGAPHAVSDLACDLLDEGVTRGTKHFMTPEQVKRLVDLYMREIGTFNDRVGVCWSSEGSKIIRAGLEDMMGEMYFGTMRITEADGFDPETGEVYDK